MSEALVRLFEELAVEVADRAEQILRDRAGSLQQTDRETPYLSVAEAAEFLRCKPQRVYDLVSSRRLTRYRDGSRVLLSRAELEEYVGGVAPRLPQPPRSRISPEVA